MWNNRKQAAAHFAGLIRGFGFRVFLASSGDYGFVTDAEGSRVLSFSFTDGGSLSGNYGPPSHESGTGWRMEEHPDNLRSADDVRRALYAMPPSWAQRHGRGWKRMTTLAEHLQTYGASSGYTEVI